MEELIEFFFKIVQRSDLFGDPDIRFIMNSKLILSDSKELINNYINPFNETNIIIVADGDNKIQDIQKIEIDFVNDNQGNVQVFIDPNKTVAELIQLYFETVNGIDHMVKKEILFFIIKTSPHPFFVRIIH